MAAKKTVTQGAAPVEPAKKRVNSFRPKKYEDHEIVDADSKVVGHIRVKPSGILWSPRNGKDWYGVPLDQLAEFLEKTGKKQTK
jgi:hypothetical protein